MWDMCKFSVIFLKLFYESKIILKYIFKKFIEKANC